MIQRRGAVEPRYSTLSRKSGLSVWAQLAIRLGLLLALLAIIIAVHWFERDSFKDNHDGQMSFADVIYFTMISATTTGYGDIVPITERARLFDALIVTPVRIFFLLILAGTAYTFIIKRTWNRWVMQRIQKTLTDHVVVAGYGVTGREAVDELIARGTRPGAIVVVDVDEDALAEAEALGCAVLSGDATRDATLEALRVVKASFLIISAGRDDTSILICLTARHLAPELSIAVLVKNEDNELPARAAGANTVINPVSFAGLLLAGSAKGSAIPDYLSDLASVDGRVRLVERTVGPEEAGRSLAELASGLGLRILRDGQPIGFWEESARSLRAGDRIIEIVPTSAGAGR